MGVSRSEKIKLVRLVYIVAFVDLMSASMITTILASYLKDHLKFTATSAGIIGSIYGVVQFFSSPLIGGIGDIKGYRYVFLLTLTFCVPSYALLISNWWLALGLARFLAGFFKQTQNLCRTFVATLAEEREKTEAFGKLNAMGNVGFIAGPAIAGYISEHFGYDSVFLLTSLAFLFNCSIVWLFFPVKMSVDINSNRKNEKGLGSLISLIGDVEWRSQWDLLILRLLLSLCVLIFRNSFNWYTTEKFKITSSTIGYLTSYQGCVAFLASYLAKQFLGLYSDTVSALLHVIALLTISMLGLWLSPVLPLYAGFLAPFVVSTSIMRVVTLELTTERCDKNDLGLLIGAGASVVSISRAVSPAFGGFLHDINAQLPTLVGIVIVLLGYYVAVVFTKRNQKLFALTPAQKIQNT